MASPTVPGIDVSAHQGVIDWSAVAASGVRFAYLRALEGKDLDPTFERNRREAREAGLLVGAYVYYRARHPARWQADLLLELLGDQLPGELPPALDVETLDGRSAIEVQAGCLGWVDRVRAACGRDPVVYTYPAFWGAELHGTPLGELARCPLWIADYRARPAPEVPRPWGQAAIWQHSGDGRCPGVAGAVDRNRWLGDEASLRAFAEARC